MLVAPWSTVRPMGGRLGSASVGAVMRPATTLVLVGRSNMPVLLHGGVLCPLEFAVALSGLGAFWGVLGYLWAVTRKRLFSR